MLHLFNVAYVEMTELQTSRTNFATEKNVDFIKVTELLAVKATKRVCFINKLCKRPPQHAP